MTKLGIKSYALEEKTWICLKRKITVVFFNESLAFKKIGP